MTLTLPLTFLRRGLAAAHPAASQWLRMRPLGGLGPRSWTTPEMHRNMGPRARRLLRSGD